MPFPVVELGDIKFPPQSSGPTSACKRRKRTRMNEAFSTQILNFALNPSTNKRAGRRCFRKHDIAKNVLELLEFRASRNADYYRLPNVHRKSDAKGEKICCTS